MLMNGRSSRQLWAFARDNALPQSEWLARVAPDGIPRNAVVVTLIFATLLSLIVIGSTVAFNIILSISTAGAYACYIVIVTTIIYRRFDGNEFPPTKYVKLSKSLRPKRRLIRLVDILLAGSACQSISCLYAILYWHSYSSFSRQHQTRRQCT